MSKSQFWPRRAAVILAYTSSIAMFSGCHQRPSAATELSPAQATREPMVRFPGVDMIRTSGGGVRIRLISAMIGDGEPLYVVDGTPIVVEPGRGLNSLRPEDIARIRVLKQPADIAVYGPSGVNGVILITTKLAAIRR